MQHINDITIYVNDRFKLEALIEDMGASSKVLTNAITMMVLCLAFFMMTVSFS